MQRYLQYEPFNIYCFEAEAWQHPVHKHSYFELIFIRSGNGKHFINGNDFSYTTGDVYLLGPEDYHYFEIAEKTFFIYLRFTEAFIKQPSSQNHPQWLQTIEAVLNTPYQSNGSIIKQEADKKLLDQLLGVLLEEYNNRHHVFFDAVMDGLMKAILSIVARNILPLLNAGNKEVRPMLLDTLMAYIRTNICHPQKLSLEHLATHFNCSSSYLSNFFRKETGESLKQYILKYKLKQAENRIKYSEQSISQIAHEFAFTDESHFNKTFRKYYGQGPRDFRKQSFKGK